MDRAKIILGTAQFGLNYGINNSSGKPSFETITNILDVAKEKKINILDTAEAYGNAHEVIGNYHRKRSYRFNVITKFSPVNTELPKPFYERVLTNLKILKLKKLHGYMFHSYNDYKLYWEEQKKDIDKLKKLKLIKKIGVSIYSNTELENVINDNNCQLIQIPFNLFDNVNQRLALIRKAKSQGIEIHSRSVFLQGLFFKDLNNFPTSLSPLKPYVFKINELAKSIKITVSNLALSYAINQKYLDGVLIGVDSVKQLVENTQVSNVILPLYIIDEINSIVISDPSLLYPLNWKK